jgi:hypothetical protein
VRATSQDLERVNSPAKDWVMLPGWVRGKLPGLGKESSPDSDLVKAMSPVKEKDLPPG